MAGKKKNNQCERRGLNQTGKVSRLVAGKFAKVVWPRPITGLRERDMNRENRRRLYSVRGAKICLLMQAYDIREMAPEESERKRKIRKTRPRTSSDSWTADKNRRDHRDRKRTRKA